MAGTAAVTGRSGFLSWSTAGSSAATTKVGALQNWTIDVSRPPIEATSFDSSGFDENITGVMTWTVKATLFNYSTDARQKSVRKQLTASSPLPLFISLYPASTSKTFQYKGKVNIESLANKGGIKDALMFDISLKGTGALTLSS